LSVENGGKGPHEIIEKKNIRFGVRVLKNHHFLKIIKKNHRLPS
jgi:hypothetical protein